MWRRFGSAGGAAGRCNVDEVGKDERGLLLLQTSALEFDLPEGRIATKPAEPRDAARLMVVSRSDPSILEHAHIRDLPRFLRPSDLLVLNTTRVLPARIEGRRVDSGGRVQGLYLGNAATHEAADRRPKVDPGERVWIAMLQGRHLHPNVRVRLSGPGEASGEGAGDSGIEITLLQRDPDEHAAWRIRVTGAPEDQTDAQVLERCGLTPLPPYILKARKHANESVDDRYDRQRYQTVYADPSTTYQGEASVAAPTAGMHLTPALLETLARQGVNRAEVTLHVGSGTFKPVETEFVEQHKMHTERCAMSAAARERILSTRRDGGRVICVGTTSARTVETFAKAAREGQRLDEWIATNLLITPGYPWTWTDGLLTNFHLPRSTLLAMVGSLLVGGVDRLKEIYAVAIEREYRFYSYGDAMLILP